MDLWDYVLELPGVNVPQLRNCLQKWFFFSQLMLKIKTYKKDSMAYRIWGALRFQFENTLGTEPGGLYSHFDSATKLSGDLKKKKQFIFLGFFSLRVPHFPTKQHCSKHSQTILSIIHSRTLPTNSIRLPLSLWGVFCLFCLFLFFNFYEYGCFTMLC